MRFIRNWKLSVSTVGIAVVGLAWLAFGYFGIHTAFIDDRVDEAVPTFDAAPADPASMPLDASATEGGDDATPDAPAADATTGSGVATEYDGDFTSLGRYDVSGEVSVLGDGSGQRFLRFEDFAANNGPDLNVYLVNPDDPDDFVDLGDLKGNIGDQNYEIPADVDLDRYSRVAIWCVRFSVGFGQADLTRA